MGTVTTSNGKLQDQYLPAVYFDSSVIIDYWMTEGMERPLEDLEYWNNWRKFSHGQLNAVMRDLLQSDKRLNKVIEIRKKLMFEDGDVTAVTSWVALWELQEWTAESGFKQLGSDILGAIFLQRKSKKEIGYYLRKAYDLWLAEGEDKHHDPETGTSGLELLIQATNINLSFAHSHGLNGIFIAELVNFCWPPRRSRNRNPFPSPLFLAYLQLGIADILHILFAHHLGCQYFASFDSDFRRSKELM
jgi:hypothetical protein